MAASPWGQLGGAGEAEAEAEAADAPAESPEVVDFCLNWALGDDSQAALLRLDPGLQKEVMEGFNPRGVLEINSKFLSFIVPYLEQQEAATGAGEAAEWGGEAAGEPAAEGADVLEEADIAAFIERFSLNDNAAGKLRSLSPDVQRVVMADFSPPSHMSEVSGKFIMFAVSIDKARAQGLGPRGVAPDRQQQIEAFVQKWGLNQDALTKLNKLPPAVQRIVMAEFSPPPHIEECSGKFIMFAASVEKRSGAAGAAAGAWGPPSAAGAGAWGPPNGRQPLQRQQHLQQHQQQQQLLRPQALRPGQGAQALQEVAAWGDPEALEQQIVDFVATWGLNEDAQAKLLGLAPEHQQIVMEQFSPPPGRAEVNGKFIMFATSVAKRNPSSGSPQLQGGRPPQMAWQAEEQYMPSPGQAWGAPPADGSMPEELVYNFCSQWGLNEDAQQKLLRLHPMAQAKVVSGFKPGPGLTSTQVSGKFIMFATSIEKAHGLQGGGGAGGCGGQAWSGWGPAPQKRPPPQAHFGMPPFGVQPAPAKRPRVGVPLDGAQTQAFVERWGLNQDATNKLHSLDPSARAVVMRDFSPKGQAQDSNGWSGKFIMFANQVQKRSQGMASRWTY